MTTAGLPAEVQYTIVGGGGGTVTQSYVYSYLSSGPNAGLLSSVVLRHKVGLGSWTTVQQVVYTYYDGSETYGNTGDMEFATVEDAGANVLNHRARLYDKLDFQGFSFGQDTQSHCRIIAHGDSDTTYYRYYTSDSSIGYTHGLEFVFRPASYARLTARSEPGDAIRRGRPWPADGDHGPQRQHHLHRL